MKRLIPLIILSLGMTLQLRAAAPYIVVLGTAQDAGAPQMGCASEFCKRAWKDKKLRKMVSSIGLVEPDSGKRWIFDATPDLPAQFELLKTVTRDASNRLDGIFLTHAHIGHYTGLMYLGRESLNTDSVPVYALPRMKTMLETNAPWSQLAGLKNIEIRELANNGSIKLSEIIEVETFQVPHRDEFSETAGFKISAGGKTAVFIPDIDKWSKWDKDLAELVTENDFLLLDGTFFEDGEIKRPMNEVPHPFVSETMNALKDLPADERKKVFFIHFNHSNPLIQGNKAKIKMVRKAGFNIASEGGLLSLE